MMSKYVFLRAHYLYVGNDNPVRVHINELTWSEAQTTEINFLPDGSKSPSIRFARIGTDGADSEFANTRK